MSSEEKREKGSPGDIEERINEAMDRIVEDPDEQEDTPIDEEYDDEDTAEEADEEWDEQEYDEEWDELEDGEESEYDMDFDDLPDDEDRPELKVELIETDPNRSRRKKAKKGKAALQPEKEYRPAAPKSARPKKITYVPISDEELEPAVFPAKKKKFKGLKVAGLVVAMMAGAVVCAYGAVTYYYSDRFFEGTIINGIDCSHKTAYEAEQAIASQVENYSIQVMSRNLEPQAIEGSKINYRYMSDGEVLNLLKQQKPYEWVRGFFETKSFTTEKSVTFDKNLLQTEVKQLSCAQPENQVEPENAYVALSGTEFTIVPETEGSKLRVKEAYKALDAAISGSQTSVDFNAAQDVYAKADVTSDSQELQATRDAYNNYTKASITYTFGENTVTLDGTTLKDWLQFDEKGQLVKDDASFQQHITEFVAKLAQDHDTVGTQREFHTTNGRTVYVYGSAYGWKINQEEEVAQLTEEIRAGAQVTRDPVYKMTANSNGYNDLGNTYIEVDMGVQHMYYYQNGSIIFDSDFVSGNMSYADRQTPEGIFTLYNKKSPDVLRGPQKPDGTYEYEQPVSFWMPFNGGIGFHDATWQPYFGGDRFLTGGSHGCINLPYDSAAALYSIIQYNVPIICFY